MLIFSEVELYSNTKPGYRAWGLVGGRPTERADFEPWTFFRNFIEDVEKPCRVIAEVITYGYGEDNGTG
jgi:hypothetical protein